LRKTPCPGFSAAKTPFYGTSRYYAMACDRGRNVQTAKLSAPAEGRISSCLRIQRSWKVSNCAFLCPSAFRATPGEVIDYDRIRRRTNELNERFEIVESAPRITPSIGGNDARSHFLSHEAGDLP